jgi:hypothetical protein
MSVNLDHVVGDLGCGEALLGLFLVGDPADVILERAHHISAVAADFHSHHASRVTNTQPVAARLTPAANPLYQPCSYSAVRMTRRGRISGGGWGLIVRARPAGGTSTQPRTRDLRHRQMRIDLLSYGHHSSVRQDVRS